MRPFVLCDKSTCILLVDLCVHMDHSSFQISPLIIHHLHLNLYQLYTFKRERAFPLNPSIFRVLLCYRFSNRFLWSFVENFYFLSTFSHTIAFQLSFHFLMQLNLTQFNIEIVTLSSMLSIATFCILILSQLLSYIESSRHTLQAFSLLHLVSKRTSHCMVYQQEVYL